VELERVLLKRSPKDPDDRYHDAQDFSDSLYDFLHTSELYVEREIIAEFMRDLFKDRLEEEERLGTPLIPNQDDVRERWRSNEESSRLSAQPSHPYEPGEKTGNADTALGAELRIADGRRRQRRHEPRGRRKRICRPIARKKRRKEEKEERGAVDADHSAGEGASAAVDGGDPSERERTREPGEHDRRNPPADMMPTVAAEPAYRPPGSLDPRVIEPRTIAPERSMEPRRAAELTEQVRARASIPALGKDGSTKDESRDQARDQARDPPRDEGKEELSKEERKEERKAREPRDPAIRENRENRENRATKSARRNIARTARSARRVR